MSDTEFIEDELFIIYFSIGIDVPSNHEEIIQFIKNDIEESADLLNWTSEDVKIGFRRFLEAYS